MLKNLKIIFFFLLTYFFFYALNEITINVVIADVVVQIHYPHYLDTGITLVYLCVTYKINELITLVINREDSVQDERKRTTLGF